MQWLYRGIGQAGIFLICAQTVVHFRPKESYDKYLKLLLSVMLLLQLLQPVMTALAGGEYSNTGEQAAEFAEELQTVLTRAGEQAAAVGDQIQSTADAVAEKSGDSQEDTASMEDTAKPVEGEATQTEEIRVEVGPVKLE